jgi:hypothetical protein
MIAVTVVIVISVIGIILIQNMNNNMINSNFYWGIEEGANFKYIVRVYGYRTFVDPENTSHIYYEPPVFVPMNNSVIIMNISNLPSIPTFVNENTFAELVIECAKVTCQLDNGSTIPLNFKDRLNRLLSHCIVPIGDWDTLDSMYPDEVENPFTPGKYISRKYLGYFEIGHILWTGFGEENWIGNVSLSSGIPFSGESYVDSVDTGAETIIKVVLIE